MRFEHYYSMTFQVLEGWYTGSQSAENLPREQVEVTETILRNHMRYSGVRELWTKSREEYPKGFADWVEEKSESLKA